MKRQNILSMLAIAVLVLGVLVTETVRRPKNEQWLQCLGEELELNWEAQQNGDKVDIIITIYNPQETRIYYRLGFRAIWGTEEDYTGTTLLDRFNGPYDFSWRSIPPNEDVKLSYRFDNQWMQFYLDPVEGFGSCKNYQYVRTWTP